MDSPGAGLRLDASWVIPVEPAGVILRDHSVVISDDRVLALLPHADAAAAYPQFTSIALPDRLLLPGLINAHTHAAMTLLRGYADDLVLQTWLQERIWPVEARWVDPKFVADGTTLACVEMLRGGVTTFADMYFFPESAIESVLAAGMRINVGLTYLNVATNYASTEEEYLTKGLQLHEKWAGHAHVGFSLAPHATYSTSPASLDRIAGLCQDHGLGVHTHLHETAVEVESERQEFGMSGVARLAEADALGPYFFGAHGVHLDESDIATLASAEASIVHCPSSNLKLGSGIAPIAALLDAGVNVALGTDGAASNNRLDLWQEMRTAALLAKGEARDPTSLPAHQALRMATLAGAYALGRSHDLGSLQPGKQADVISVDIGGVENAPMYDPASAAVYVLGREHVRDVWVAGRQVVDDGQCTTVDQVRAVAAVRDWADRLSAHSSA